jgi:hypothetical protein
MNLFANIGPVLAAVTVSAPTAENLGLPPAAPAAVSSFRATDILLVILAVLLVMTVLVCWAIFVRKPKTDGTRTRIYKSKEPREQELEDGTIRKKKRLKKPRRSHRNRNPTLSEIGGLPPMRSGDTPKSDS